MKIRGPLSLNVDHGTLVTIAYILMEVGKENGTGEGREGKRKRGEK